MRRRTLVTEDAKRHAGARDDRELDGSAETLVTLGVVVLQADLEFDRLQEVPLLGLVGVLKEFLDVPINCVSAAQIESYRESTHWRTPATEIFDMMIRLPKWFYRYFGGSGGSC
jgi:hypothetical protein